MLAAVWTCAGLYQLKCGLLVTDTFGLLTGFAVLYLWYGY